MKIKNMRKILKKIKLSDPRWKRLAVLAAILATALNPGTPWRD